MLSTRGIGLARSTDSGIWSARWSVAAVLIAMTVVAVCIQLNTYPNHDVAWILWGTREMLRGGEFGVDIIEPNPPLAWYLAIPTTALAMQIGWPLDWTFRIAVAFAAAISAACFGQLASDGSNNRRLLLTAIAGIALLIIPGREFGQREHLAVLAALPYLGLVARRLGKQAPPSNRISFAIGVAAGLGFALKPYFLGVPLIVEVAAQLHRRRLPLFRAENLAIGAVILVYVGVILAFEQDYLRQSVPLANEIYWSFNRPWYVVWAPLRPWLLMVVPVSAYAIYRRDELGVLLAAASCGFILSYVIQHKGYGYHLLPVTVIVLVMFAHLSTTGEKAVRLPALVAMLVLLLVAGQPVMAWWQANQPGGVRTLEIERIVQSIDRHAGHGRFLVVAVHPYPAFPPAIYTDAQYVSRTNSQWFLPATMQIRQGLTQRPEAASIENHAREFIMHDLSRQPNLVLIDRDSARHTNSVGNVDFVSFYLEDPKFRDLWQDYREIEPIGQFRQFVRVSAHSDRPVSSQ